jgi:hypothetical protein
MITNAPIDLGKASKETKHVSGPIPDNMFVQTGEL